MLDRSAQVVERLEAAGPEVEILPDTRWGQAPQCPAPVGCQHAECGVAVGPAAAAEMEMAGPGATVRENVVLPAWQLGGFITRI